VIGAEMRLKCEMSIKFMVALACNFFVLLCIIIVKLAKIVLCAHKFCLPSVQGGLIF
jgi:hypothetical protein